MTVVTGDELVQSVTLHTERHWLLHSYVCPYVVTIHFIYFLVWLNLQWLHLTSLLNIFFQKVKAPLFFHYTGNRAISSSIIRNLHYLLIRGSFTFQHNTKKWNFKSIDCIVLCRGAISLVPDTFLINWNLVKRTLTYIVRNKCYVNH